MRLLPLACLALLAACASRDPDYYTLQALPGTQLTDGPATVEVRRPGLAGYLDRSDIVLRTQDYRLALNSQVHWAEPLGDMIARVLAADLSQRLPGSSVFDQAGAITADPAARVEVDIRNFNADETGAVVLTAELAIEAGATHHPISTRHVALTAPVPSPGPAALAATMSALLARLADATAAGLIARK